MGSSAALVVPLKSFANAKGRLASILDPEQRERLSRACAERVVGAAGDVRVVIVSDQGTDVSEWADVRGLTCITQTSPGLNGAARDGVVWARENGFTIAVIAHSDIPLADNVAQFIDDNAVVIVPDSKNDGTNVLVLPTAADFTFHYGPGSFKQHVDEAIRRGFAPRIALSDEWSHDLDNPDDLSDPRIKELFPWL